MKTATATRPGWLGDLFAAIDRRDTPGFLGFLHDDAVFRFGNAPEAHGHHAIGAAVSGFFSTIAGVRHDVDDAWELGDTVICRGKVTYLRRDDTAITVPFANVFRLRGNRIVRYDIYVDASPLFEGNA